MQAIFNNCGNNVSVAEMKYASVFYNIAELFKKIRRIFPLIEQSILDELLKMCINNVGYYCKINVKRGLM